MEKFFIQQSSASFEKIMAEIKKRGGKVHGNEKPITVEKRGTCVITTDEGWKIDTEIPIFTGDGRKYIEDLIVDPN